MRALAIDTSTHRAEIALLAGETCVAREQSYEQAKHAEALFAMIDRAFAAAGWSRSDLDLVVPCLGPGSFTGVRVGLATSKGIALALDRPIVGVCGLDAMASAAWRRAPARGVDADVVVALIDARKGEVFWKAYGREGEPLGGPGHAAAPLLPDLFATLPAKKLVVGEIAGEIASSAGLTPASVYRSPETDLPDGVELARMGVRTFETRGPDDLASIEPIYVRPPDITLPKPK
jgi:tRNA threonylcarbamoyladenosine biosynthesis protein TsaB